MRRGAIRVGWPVFPRGSNGYNAYRGPGERRVDFSMYKNFSGTERFNIQFRWEGFNFFNTPWFGDSAGISFSAVNQLTPNGTRDGEIRGLRTPVRIMQFGLKLRFLRNTRKTEPARALAQPRVPSVLAARSVPFALLTRSRPRSMPIL